MPTERLQKILARAGYGSRRHAESLIAARRVQVDGHIATLGEQADAELNAVTVDGKPIRFPAVGTTTWMLNKPIGYVVTTSDEQDRPTIYDLLPPEAASLRYVGRLDIDTAGLLLLTSDGLLTHRLTHPRYGVWKTYEAEVDALPSERAIEQLRRGVQLEDGVTAPARVRVLRGAPRPRLELQIREGRKREVRRMLAAVDAPVHRLRRTAFGGLMLGDLPAGTARPLDEAEDRELRRLVGMPPAVDADEPGSLSSSAPPHRSAARGRPPISTDSLARSIAIDGPAASGKSVVGRSLAEHLGLGFVDTGLMYRACTLAVLDRGIDPDDEQAVTTLVRNLDLDLQWPDPTTPHAFLDGVDVTDRLRASEIERSVSLISRIPEVRDELVHRQRALASRSPIVMAGRDIGTRVLTEARTKVFLEASTEIRARRRLGEELDAGRATTFERVLEETRQRDEMDSTGKRAIRREQAAEDAIIVDTDMIGIDEVVEACLNAYRAANGS